jgi:hypothetical protein
MESGGDIVLALSVRPSLHVNNARSLFFTKFIVNTPYSYFFHFSHNILEKRVILFYAFSLGLVNIRLFKWS